MLIKFSGPVQFLKIIFLVIQVKFLKKIIKIELNKMIPYLRYQFCYNNFLQITANIKSSSMKGVCIGVFAVTHFVQ